MKFFRRWGRSPGSGTGSTPPRSPGTPHPEAGQVPAHADAEPQPSGGGIANPAVPDVPPTVPDVPPSAPDVSPAGEGTADLADPFALAVAAVGLESRLGGVGVPSAAQADDQVRQLRPLEPADPGMTGPQVGLLHAALAGRQLDQGDVTAARTSAEAAVKQLGGSGADRLTGNAVGNRIHGGPGRDHVTGGAGHDLLVGESGNDTLRGNTGDDHLIGEFEHPDKPGSDGDGRNNPRARDLLDGGTAAARGDRRLGSPGRVPVLSDRF